MNVVTFWVLVTLTNGSYNPGVVQVQPLRFASQAQCEQTRNEVASMNDRSADRPPRFYAKCVKVEGLKP